MFSFALKYLHFRAVHPQAIHATSAAKIATTTARVSIGSIWKPSRARSGARPALRPLDAPGPPYASPPGRRTHGQRSAGGPDPAKMRRGGIGGRYGGHEPARRELATLLAGSESRAAPAIAT